MAMNPIASYRMPNADDVPTAAVPWRPRPDRAVLLVHDMQRYFLRAFPAGLPPLTDLLINTSALLTAARAVGVPVVYTAQPGGMSRRDRGLLHDFWGPGMDATEDDRAIVTAVAPAPSDTVLTKWRYSAFHRSELAARLRRTHRDQLVICGVYAHVGCLITACDAFAHDIQPFLVSDAMADFSVEHHMMALRYAASRCAVPMSTVDVVAELERHPAASMSTADSCPVE